MRSLLAAVLVVDAILLAVLELFFLPLRADGTLLPALGAFPVPVSLVVAAITTPVLVLAGRALVGPPFAGVVLAVWAGAAIAFAMFGPGGDRVFVGDWRGLLLLAVGALPGAFAVGGSLRTGREAKVGG
ncbi:hypothetical protein [Amycolatopsis albispora]|uniref:Uncharacterized protein n=1 Tax=Amycolatopsis albispora TaxID=1804986 RepID=A0A344LAJ0_9PSEU|nr:hypothetical protein [Amycolatopsis albispora]AXB45064.1 hypothetical protein A4R43_23320 [Amycolatopsis albispora]